MASRGSVVRGVAAAAAAVALLSGCDSGSSETPAPEASPTALPPAPTSFNPCTDIPQNVLDSEGLHNRDPDDADAGGGTQWRGCGWVQSDGYAVSITSTNVTLPAIRGNQKFQVNEELSIAGRPALTYHNPATVSSSRDCSVNIEIKGGTLEFMLINPASNRLTGMMDTCELGKTLAGKVAPLLPATA